MNALLLYLLETSLYLIVLTTVYRLLLASLTHFHWMRGYLVASVVLGLAVPLLPMPTLGLSEFLSQGTEGAPLSFSLTTFSNGFASVASSPNLSSDDTTDWASFLTWLLLGGYGLGLIYKLGGLTRNVWNIHQ